jgi:predicted transcriptional regulator of viral defense system
MKESLLLKKLRLNSKEFVTSTELKNYCRRMNLNYKSAIGHFVARGHLTRIFKGIFYVKSLNEVRLGKTKYNNLELVAKGLELKDIKNWYFGLYSALKLNNMTHEHFAIEYVISDKVFRAKPIKIAGYKFRFVKLKPSLLTFGIIKNGLRYSDPEKTILDFVYRWRYNGIPKEKIVADGSEWGKNLSKLKVKNYSKSYPKTVQEIVGELVG